MRFFVSFPLGLPNIKIDQLKSSSLPFNSANCFSQAQLSINNWFRAILAGKMAQQDKNLLYEASSLWSIDSPIQVLINSKKKEITQSSFVQMVLLYPFFTHFFSNKRKCIRNIFNKPLYHFYNLWDKNSTACWRAPLSICSNKGPRHWQIDTLTYWRHEWAPFLVRGTQLTFRLILSARTWDGFVNLWWLKVN